MSAAARTLLAALMLALMLAPEPLGAGETGVWRDDASGLAIGGFDPVAYFVRDRPVRGRPDIALDHAGAGWQFENSGNRAAFRRNPDVYSPRFFGFDPVNLAAGKPVAGQPALFAIEGGRLYLFSDSANQARFRQAPDRLLRAAALRWPGLAITLTNVHDR